MASDRTAPKRKPRSQASKRRRRIREWFTRSHGLVIEAVYGVSTALDFRDEDRILEAIALQTLTYDGPEDRKSFREWLTAQADRLTELTVTIKGLELDDEAIKVHGLERLVQYDGNVTDAGSVQEWAISLYIVDKGRELRNSDIFRKWFKTYKKSVLLGVWSVVKFNKDLLPGQVDSCTARTVAEDLATDTWMWIHEHVDALLEPGTAPLHIRLKRRGWFTARAWRQDRLRHLEKCPENRAPVMVPIDAVEYRGAKSSKKPSLGEIERRAA